MTLEQLGWNAHFAQRYEVLERSGCIPGRVARQDRDSYIVYAANRALRAAVSGALRHRALAPADFPAVGDWIAVSRHSAGAAGTIHDILPRQSAIVRQAAGAPAAQVLAANVDTLLICCGLDGDYNPRRIERYLSLAYGCGVAPVVLLTKADLCDSAEERIAEVQLLAARAQVFAVSTVDWRGLAQLRALVPPGITAALAGSSGVGKSSLVNALLGGHVLKTAPVRQDDSRGRHTTTHRQLLPVPGGGVIIDTPGMRELALWAGGTDVDSAFSDIARYATKCRFRDCSHTHEPGCRVRAALQSGELDPQRLASYEKQQREIAYFETRDDPAALAAQRARWKAIHKSAKKWMKEKYR